MEWCGSASGGTSRAGSSQLTRIHRTPGCAALCPLPPGRSSRAGRLAGLRRLSGRFITNEDAEAAAGERSVRDLRIKATSIFTITGTLSGGNQQKVVLAKWLLTNPRVLFLDEPTRGIDVGAKQEIYAQINRLAESGIAIILVSSELPEVLGLSDRVIVLHEGRITGEFTRNEASPEAVMSCATGRARQAA